MEIESNKEIIYTNDFSNDNFKINLLPDKLHYISLARNLPKKVWDKFRKKHIIDKNLTCELCGYKMRSYHNCHEIFEVSDDTVKLIGIKVLCYNCHMTQHVGFVSTGKASITIDQLAKYYESISGKDFETEKRKSLEEYARVSKILFGKKLKFEIDDNLLGREIIEDYIDLISGLIKY